MPNAPKACTDPIVGAILSGWRYDISAISPEMRTDYEQHLEECAQCQKRQTIARTIDVLLISATSLMIVGFLLTAVVLHRMEAMRAVVQDIPALHTRLRSMPVTISLQAVDVAGLVVSTGLWILVAIATPVPGYLGGFVVKRLPSDLRQRIERRHA